MADDDFFIGWAETPPTDRRFFLRAGLGLMAGTALLAGGAAAFQRAPGPGTWDAAAEQDFTGLLTVNPYPMLRTKDVDGQARTALISCAVKCGVEAEAASYDGQMVTVRGSLVRRGDHMLISATETGPWIQGLAMPPDPDLITPSPTGGQPVTLTGEVLDSKCWFGAMRPGQGKVHKACASLCIRGGIPPAFFTQSPQSQPRLTILTDGGQRFGEDILPFVADRIEITGLMREAGGLVFLDTSASAFVRL